MNEKNCIGVCVDDGIAYILEDKNDENIITIIEVQNAAFELDADHEVSKYQRQKRREHEFYKRIFDIIKNFDKVSLFGIEKAKNELISLIHDDFLKIEIQSDPFKEKKITEDQRIDFINNYFKP